MRKTKVIFSVLAALCLMAFSASAANAAGIGGGPAFSGSNAGLGAHTFTTAGGGLTVSCATVTNSGTTNPSPVDVHGHRRSANFNIAFSSCTLRVAGLTFPATVTTNCAWTATINTFNTATGASTGNITTNCTTTITVSGSTCTVTVGNVTVVVTGQNDPPPPATPTSIVISVNASGIPVTTSGCPGVPASTTATYVGRKRENGIWAID